MNSKNKSLEELNNQGINYFRVIWGWKWAVILIPLIAMITAKLTEQPIPEIYETRASIIISEHGIQKPLSKTTFESIAFSPTILQKTIDQLSLKMEDGTSMNQKTLKNQLKIKTEIPKNPASPVAPGFLFFIVRNENPDLAKKLADLWVQLVKKEAKRIEALNFRSKDHPSAKIFISLKLGQLNSYNNTLMRSKLELAEKISILSTYQKRLKTSSDYKIHIIPKISFSTHTRQLNQYMILRDHPGLKNESSSLSVGTTLHPTLESLILDSESEIEALDSKIHLLNTNIKKLKEELFELTLGKFPVTMGIFPNLKQTQLKPDSRIASINYAPLRKTPIPREINIHIFLAGIISFGFILLACVLKAHIDLMKQE